MSDQTHVSYIAWVDSLPLSREAPSLAFWSASSCPSLHARASKRDLQTRNSELPLSSFRFCLCARLLLFQVQKVFLNL